VLDQPQWRAAVRRDGPEFVASQFGLDPMIAETLDVYGRSAFMTHQGDRLTDSLIPEVESADRFEFGRNWKRFIRDHLSQEQIEHSKRHLLDFLGLADLRGRSFLDIGCGSGLHSLAAHQSGAHDIFGFDYDPHSVDATLVCRRFAGDPRNWRVVQGSILDEAFVGSLSLADIVYSWGVLHHTGDVWRGIRNAASRVRDGGVFYLALYSADVQKDPPPEFWLDVKRRYNRATWLGKRRMDLWYIWRFAMGQDVRKLPVILARVIGFGGHRRGRGMSFFTDVRDWLGGWPMEFVYDREVIQFCEGCGLVLDKIRTGEANTEFLFRRPPASQAAPPPGTAV
jgi:SAM-dependent methyltransferase